MERRAADAWELAARLLSDPRRIVSIDDGLERMRGWMAKYADLPCDFADTSLLYAAWQRSPLDPNQLASVRQQVNPH